MALSSLESAPYPAVYKGQDVTGYKFGLFTVMGKLRTHKYQSGKTQPIWLVQCDCGRMIEAQSQGVVRAKYGCTWCKGEIMSGVNSIHWRGGVHVPGYFVAQVKGKLIRGTRTLDFDLSFDYLDKLWHQQKQKCAYTGYALNFGSNSTEGTASLDRIDSALGYIEGNVQFVHKTINLMKWSLSDQEFRDFCRAVANNDSN